MALKRKRIAKQRAWNKGLVIGQSQAFTVEQVKRIRTLLAGRGARGIRDLALFSLAIDSMLQATILLRLKVADVRSRNGSIRSIIEVTNKRRALPRRCALSKFTIKALEKWLTASGKKPSDYLFHGRKEETSAPLTTRQLSRLVKEWARDAGLNASDFGTESLRRTKARHILLNTGNLQVVRKLLGHQKIEQTEQFLGEESNADPIAICRAFDF